MINMNSFSIAELWKQFYWVYIYDDLLDAKQLAPAIRYHPALDDSYLVTFNNQLAEILVDSIRRCSIPWIQFVLDEGTELTPYAIHEAIFFEMPDGDRLSMFDAFVERGWNPDSVDDDGVPFLNSVTHSHTLTAWFLSHGINPNKLNPLDNDSALDCAAQYGSIDTIQLLMSCGAQFNSGAALQLAVSRPENDSVILPIMRFLLSQHLSVSEVQQDLDTALHAAVWCGSPARVTLLLERGADAHQPGVQRPPPLQYARQLGDVTIEKLLMTWQNRPREAPGQWVVVEEEEEFVAVEADGWEAINHGMESMVVEEIKIASGMVPGFTPLGRAPLPPPPPAPTVPPAPQLV